jgi:hypothetical protein
MINRFNTYPMKEEDKNTEKNTMKQILQQKSAGNK